MKALYLPLLILTLLLLLSLSHAAYTADQAALCALPLQRADAAAQQGRWADAARDLRDSHSRWLRARPYFHVTLEHQELDGAESLYAEAFAACREMDAPDFFAALARLQTALGHIAGKQQPTLGNIL